MTLKNVCKLTLISGAILIESIKWVIRPLCHTIKPLNFFLGIAPNLLGAFLLPFGCYWLLNRFINVHDDKQLRLFCTISFFLLVINELLQLVPAFGRTFDYYDIAASAVGLIASYFLCGRYLFRKLATFP